MIASTPGLPKSAHFLQPAAGLEQHAHAEANEGFTFQAKPVELSTAP